MLESTHPMSDLLRRDRRYHFDSYVFVLDALRYGQVNLEMGKAQPSADVEPEEDEDDSLQEPHVTGQELCEAIRQYALDQYGMLARSVLNHWGIRETGDFGEIVFNLIDIGQMRKTEHDRREDFEDVYDFEQALTCPPSFKRIEARPERL